MSAFPAFRFAPSGYETPLIPCIMGHGFPYDVNAYAEPRQERPVEWAQAVADLRKAGCKGIASDFS